MNRLWVRLSLAFAFVAAVAVVAVAMLLGYQADTEFRQYVTRSMFASQGGLLEELAMHYQHRNSWEGAESLLGAVPAAAESRMMGRGPMMGRRPMMGGRTGLVLADANGLVLYGEDGRGLSESERSRSQEITIDGVTVGYLLARSPGTEVLGPLEQGFLSRLQTSLLTGAAAAAVLSVLLGLLLSRNLSAPLGRLSKASRAVAAGDFSQRVEEGGSAEIAEVARSFNEMTTALEAGEILRHNLMADVAHELRTPLTVLQGNLQALLDDVYPMDKGEIAHLYDETRLLGRLVEDLRELALAEAGQLRLNLRPTDVGEVIHSTASTFALVAKDQSVDLTVDIDAELPLAMSDPDRVAQVLRNLLGNGLRHTPAGGQITISAQTAGDEGDEIEIDVVDTGEGIEPEDLPHVFERFWRVDRSRSRDSGGSGLGLTIAKQLVTAQGGRIGVESEPGRGSRFWIRLPVAS